MTQSGMTSSPNPAAPEVSVAASLSASAGTAASIPVTVRHRGAIPAIMRVTVLGLDARWAPEPVDLGPVQPGETTGVVLTLVPERGAMGARYPFAVAVEANPLYGDGPTLMGIAESVLVVDSQERIAMAIQPPTPVAVFSKRFDLQITNPGTVDRDFSLKSSAAHGASVSLSRDTVRVPAQRSVAVRGRVRVRHPRFMGGDNTFTFGVSARGMGAPEFAEATVRARPVFSRGLRVAVGLIAVIAAWAAAALIFIPKISDHFTPKVAVAPPATVTSVGPSASTAGGSGTGGGGGAGGTGGTAAGGTGAGGSGGSGGAGGSGAAGAGGAGAANAAGYQVAGTIGGPSPAGTTVSLQQVTLTQAAENGAAAAPGTNTSTGNALRGAESGAFAKIAGDALGSTPRVASGTGSLTTKADGAFQFAGVQAPGYYLLTASKPGFQTQKFLIDSTDLAQPTPLKITMTPANGVLSGSIVDNATGQAIGAATITITDGTVALQTSSVSSNTQGTPGSFQVNGVSTPGTYLVTASAPGYGTESSVVQLAAGGKGSTNLKLKKGVGAIVGTVSGDTGTGTPQPLGGITVSATNGTVTSTATTVTAGPVGSFTLPDLPVPGDYIVTISGDGYQTQTRSLTFAAGVGSATLNATLVPTQGRVTGSVFGKDVTGKDEGTLVGVGMTLTNSQATYKTMTTSEPKGQFDFTGVPPGTYVLSATQFGRQPASATVHVAAATTSSQNLTLVASSSTVLPPDSFIKGSVLDSRASGPLTCDRAALPVPKKDCVATVTVATSTGTVKATTKTGPDFTYLIPNSTNPANGLTPGLYVLTVSAPGYETTTQQVQVGQSQTVTAPPISLPVLGLVSGTITTRVGTPQAPTCVVAIGVATTVPSPLPTSCTPASSGATCTVPGLGVLPCGLTSMGGADQAPAGTYAIAGLTHGAYQLLAIAQDPEYRYVITNLPTVQIALGGDAQFNAVLDRLGRVQLAVSQVNKATGQLDPAGGATVSVAGSAPVSFGQIPCAGGAASRPALTGTTCPDGSALLTGLNGNYTITVEGPGGHATVPSGAVGLNQTVGIPMTLSEAVGPFVGRITTTGIDGSAIGLVGAAVTVTGTVDFNGTTAVPGSATVTTDSNGCYAILPANYTLPTGATLTSTDCPNPVPTSSTATAVNTATNQSASIRVDQITIAVAALGNRTTALPTTAATVTGNDTVRAVPTFSVAPKPVDFGTAQRLTVNGPPGFTAPDLSTAVFTILSKPALAGPVVITPAQTTPGQIPGGVVSTSLSFTDPSIPPQVAIAYPAMPGVYTVQITLSGFVTTTVTLTCPLGDPGNLLKTCSFNTPPTLNQLPSVTGSMTAPALPPTTGNPTGQPDWGAAVVSMITGPTNLGNLAMIASPTDPFTGIVTFSGATSAIAAAGGKYTFSIALPGYASAPVTVTCGANFTSAPAATFGCTPLTPATGTLTRLPTFQGTLAMGAPVGVTVPVTSATVTAVDTINSANRITIQVQPNGSLLWTDAPQPAGVVAPGSYAITYTAQGFSTDTVSFNCNAGASCGPGAHTIRMLPQIGGTITLADGGSTVANTSITLTATHPPNLGAITIGVSSTGAVSYTDAGRPAAGTNGLPAGLALPGTYIFNVSLTGYQSTSVTVTCGDDYTGGATPPVGQVNGCTPLSATLAPLPTFDSTSSTVSLSSATSPYGDVTFNLSNVTATVTPNPGSRIAATVDSTGAVHWLDSTPGVLSGQIVPGTYTITYSMGGFQTGTATVTCASSATTCTAGATELLMLPKGLGTVTIPLPPHATDVDLTKATVTPNSPPAASTSVAGLHLSLTETANDGTTVTASIIWTDTRQPFAGVIQPDTYSVTVKIPGYKTVTSSSVTCTYGGSCAPAIAMQANPPFSGQLSILPASPTTAASLGVQAPNNVGSVSLTADTSGNLTWQQQGMPLNVVQPGTYTITAQLAGYQFVVGGQVVTTTTFTCTDTTCNFPQITLTQPTNLVINLASSGSTAPTTASLVLKQGSTTVGSPSTSTGSFSFTGQSTAAPSSYTLTTRAAGFVFEDTALGSSASTIVCTNPGATLPATGLVLGPGGTTTCTVTLQQLGTITAQTNWNMIDTKGNTVASSAVGTIAVTAQLLSGGSPTGPVFSGTSSGTGALTLTGTLTNQGLAPGQYQIKASPTGYTPFVGTITIDANHDMVSATGDITVTSGVAQIQLQTPSNLSLQVTLNSSANVGTAIMPAVTITLTDAASNMLTCNTAATSGNDCTITNTTSNKYVTFTGIPPGNYQAAATSNDGSYSALPAQNIQLLPGATTARTTTLTLTPLVSSITGAVVDPNHAAIPGAKVQLWPWQGTGPATDFNGTAFATQTADSSGLFTFGLVRNGNYQLVVDAPGYQRVISGIIPVSYPTAVPAQTVATTTPTYRNTTLTFPSPAASLAGATVTLTPVAGTSLRTPDNTVISGIAITGSGTSGNPWTATIPQLPTGKWTVSVTRSGSPFPSPATATLDASENSDKSQAQPALNTSVTLNEASTSFEFDWTSQPCLTDPSGTIPIAVSSSGVTGSLAVSLTVNSAQHKATGTAVLPPGTYTWNTSSAPTGWAGPATDTSVTVANPAVAGSSSATLAAVTATVTVTLTIDGTTAGSSYNTAKITPTCGTTAGTAKALSSGTTTFTLVPGTWSFGIATTDTAHPIVLGAQSNVTVTAAGPNAVTFAGNGITPAVTVTNPTGRASDSTARPISGSLYAGTDATGTDVWDVPSGTKITGTGAGYTGPTLVVDPGPYFLSAQTTDTGDVFGSGTASVTVSSSQSSAASISAPLAYVASIATVTVTKGGAALVGSDQASITVKKHSSGTTAGTGTTGTGANVGAATIFDLAPGTQYDVTATDGGYTGTNSLTTAATGGTANTNPVTVDLVGALTVTVQKHGSTLSSSDPAAAVTLTDTSSNTDGPQNTATSSPGIGTTTFTGLPPGGSYTVTAAGSGTDSGLVGTATASITGSSNTVTVKYGATLTVTAQVSGSTVAATITVKLGTTTITPTSTGTGTATYANLQAGTYAISATYTSGTTYNGTASSTINTGNMGTFVNVTVPLT
jgi:hypothetical protein